MKKRFALWLILVLCVTGCGVARSEQVEYVRPAEGAFIASDTTSNEMEVAEAKAEENQEAIELDEQYQDQLIYNCSIDLETLYYDDTINQLKTRVQENKGFIQEDNTYINRYDKEETTRHCTMVIRIPVKQYDAFLSGISEAGTLVRMNSYVENVTQEYYDMETRIKALDIQETRLLELLKETDNVSDMITVESRLSEVQSEKDRYQTRLNILKKDVAYSTFTISVDEVKNISVRADGFGNRLLKELGDSARFFMNSLQEILIACIYIAPFAIVVLLIVWIIRIIYKKRKHKKE